MLCKVKRKTLGFCMSMDKGHEIISFNKLISAY